MRYRWGGLILAVLLLGLPVAGEEAGGPGAAPGGAGAPRLQGGFAEFWQAHNGALLFGEPLTEESRAGGVVVQYLERARLEWHPDYPAGQQITLGRLGAELLGARRFAPIAAFPSNAGHLYFAVTGHSIQGDILQFWQAQGGLAIFGYPLSEELTEDGRTVQYFERARLEHHPELGKAYRVLPSPVGALALRARGQAVAAAVVVEPPEIAEGHSGVIKIVPPVGGTVVSGTLGTNVLAFTCCLPLTQGAGRVDQPWAGVGTEPYGAVGPLALRVTVQGADGSRQTVERAITVRRYPFDELRTVYHGARIAPATREAEHAVLDAVFAGRSGPPRWRGPFAVPLHRSLVINAPFGQRRAYNNEPPYETHWGVDYDAAAGTPVLAPAAGTVVLARPLELRGNTLIVDHGAGVFTLYAHLSAFKVEVGQAVQVGEVIALVGSTGNALGPHLHWEVHVAGPAVEPQEWVARGWP
jgi:biotin carboxyl carrier protein